MLSKLSRIVGEIAEKEGLKVEDYKMKNIKLIELGLDKSGDIETAMVELDKELDYHWNDHLSAIKKQLERNK